MNVIVGTNNSGKSTIFKGLNVLRYYRLACSPSESVYSSPLGYSFWNNSCYQLHNFEESVYNHDLRKIITISAEYDSGIMDRIMIKNDRIIDKYHMSGKEILTEDKVFTKNKQLDYTFKKLCSEHKKVNYYGPNRPIISHDSRLEDNSSTSKSLDPFGGNITQFLLEKYSRQDPKCKDLQEWFEKFDPKLTLLKTPLRFNEACLETERNDKNITTSINLSLQGNGIQNIITIVTGIIFSDSDTTIIIEEPENFIHSRNIELLVDLFNYAVNNLNKQIIIVTHSFEIINYYCSDVGAGRPRGKQHVKIDPQKFKLITIHEDLGKDKIQEYDLINKEYMDVRMDFKKLWG
jgi:AAA15 family ATPase/GTPase